MRANICSPQIGYQWQIQEMAQHKFSLESQWDFCGNQQKQGRLKSSFLLTKPPPEHG